MSRVKPIVYRKKLKLVIAMLMVIGLSAFFIVNAALAATWTKEVVDPTPNVGQDTSLEFDAAGNAHISYYDFGSKNLKVAIWNGSGWTIQDVDTGGRVGKDTSIDASGNISISYYDETNGNLKFARRISGIWQTQVVDYGSAPAGVVGEYTSVEIDASGKAHISYYNESGGDLKYALEVTPGTGNCGEGNGWSCLTIDSPGSVGKFTSMELDSTGKAHISYYDETNSDLKYAVEVGVGITGNCDDGNWQCTVIDTPAGGPASTVGKYSSLALDNYDKAHVSYYDEGNSSLKHAEEIHDGSTGNCNGGTWNCQTVDNTGNMGMYSSIDIDAYGPPRISYYDSGAHNLKFAIQRNDGTWARETVDTSGDTGKYTSLAIKPGGASCISYYGGSGNLGYACTDGSSPPAVSGLAPSGWVGSSATLTASYTDNGSIAQVNVELDGTEITSLCTVGASSVSCPVTVTDGGHSFTVVVHDDTGLVTSATGSFNADSTAPTISGISPAGSVPAGSTTVTIDYSDAGSGIDTGSVTVTLDGSPLSCTVTGTGATCDAGVLSTGTYSIGGTVSDNGGNTASISSSFDVAPPPDTTPPVLTLPGNTDLTTTDPSGAVWSFSASATDDIDGPVAVTCTPPAGASYTYPVGTTPVSCSASDAAGNTATGAFDVNVVWNDVTPPVVSVPADMTVHTTDPAGTAVSFTATATDPDDAAGPVTCTPPSGSVFSVGTTAVSCSSTDTHGNTGTASFNIEVILDDVTAPSVTGVSPSGTISSDWTMVFVSYSDSGSGIDTGSVHVTLDGAALTCTVTASSANCSVIDLADGPHTIGGSVADHDGNVAPFSGGFIVSYLPPAENLLSPHGSYGTGNAGGSAKTDYCLTCHDVHNAAGDYVLMRESTVTNVCGTCHLLYGNDTGSSPTWTEPPCDRAPGSTSSGCAADLNISSPEATVSPSAAYKNTNSASGHRLGLGSDTIPASSNSLKVIRSEDYEEGEIYDHNPASSLSATSGLYCASCHTPHGSITGRDFPACPDPDGAGPEVAPANGPACDADTDKDIPTPTAVYASDGSGVITGEFFSGDQLVVDDSGAEHPHRAYPQWLASSNPNHLSARELTGEADGDGDGVFCEATDGFVAADDQYGTAPGTIIPNGLCDKMMAPVDPVQSRDEFCLRCHDKQWNGHGFEGAFEGEGTGGNNHPPLCMSCHGPAMETNTGTNDFPHTSENYKILSKDHDGLCLGCHTNGRLP